MIVQPLDFLICNAILDRIVPPKLGQECGKNRRWESMMASGGLMQPAQVVTQFLGQRHSLIIGDSRPPSSNGDSFGVLDPATGQTVAAVPKADAHDIDAAVIAARRAFENPAWRRMSAEARSKLLWRYADLLDQHREELAQLEVITNGMPMAFAQWGVDVSAGWLRHFAGMTSRVVGRNTSAVVSQPGMPFHSYTALEPIGVVGLIVPWNGPIAAMMIKLAPALAAGCTCVVKPAEDTPVTALRLGELALEAGFPAGVVNIVTGFGDVGAALVDHPDVDKISFTGSTETGKRVMQSAAGTIKRVTLELGGKSPCIVFDDANMDAAVQSAAMAIFGNTGQVCFAGSRLYVQRKSFDRVIDGVAKIAQTLKLGSGLDPASQLGPLISAKHRQRVCDYITAGEQEGGTVVTGGRATEGDGFFFKPTVFTGVTASARIVREEIFGPVVVATPFDELEEVTALANDTSFGLGAGIFTTNLSRAHLLADRIRAGNVWVNSYAMVDPSMPFGGFKQSGVGREMGEEGFLAFLEAKSVYVSLSEG